MGVCIVDVCFVDVCLCFVFLSFGGGICLVLFVSYVPYVIFSLEVFVCIQHSIDGLIGCFFSESKVSYFI